MGWVPGSGVMRKCVAGRGWGVMGCGSAGGTIVGCGSIGVLYPVGWGVRRQKGFGKGEVHACCSCSPTKQCSASQAGAVLG